MIERNSPHAPAFLREAVSGSRHLRMTFENVSDTNILSHTSSFIYDPPGYPLKSTQQIDLDWSQFEQHTFFMSAEAKVNLAFDKIINSYPFDGSRAEVEAFFEKLTGFENYVFDSFPKHRGQLHFSGSRRDGTGSSQASGSYVIVRDHAGSLFPELSKNSSGGSILNPIGTSLSIEMHVMLPASATEGVQVICQKTFGDDQGFTLYLNPTTSTTVADVAFNVVSGSTSLFVPTTLTKGVFEHICVILNREREPHVLEFCKSAERVATSVDYAVIGDLGIDASSFLIGSGSAFRVTGTIITPNQTMSGTLDELRVFHSARSTKHQELYAAKSMFSVPELKLYYKFNEPEVPLATNSDDLVNSIVIDSSGNSLHSFISNFFSYDGLRLDVSSSSAHKMIFERDDVSPVLFPAHLEVIALNDDLLTSASLYDDENPNIITKLIPSHYLLEGNAFEGFEDTNGTLAGSFGGSGPPGSGEPGSVQVMLSFLYIWAMFFDELKIFADAFSTLKTVDYDANVSMPGNFLFDFMKQNGFFLPPLFNNSTLEQFIRAENVDEDVGSNTNSLKHIQQELLRRTLVNLPDIIKSKGTQHAVKAFLRSIGIDPENSVRIRELGGPNERQLTFVRERKRSVSTMVEFATSSFVQSPFLSSSRVEPGFPTPAGSIIHDSLHPTFGYSNNANDGLLTSGSWTVEASILYKPAHVTAMTNTSQSICRLCVTGSTMTGSVGLLANLVAMSSSVDPHLTLFVRSGNTRTSSFFRMDTPLALGDLFDGDVWNVSFGCVRNDEIDSRVSSSYFVRYAKQLSGDVDVFFNSSSFFEEARGSAVNVFHALDFVSGTNASGSFIAIGSQSMPAGTDPGIGYLYLNDSGLVTNEARVVNFDGMMSGLRFWSRALTVDEWREHVRNLNSKGTLDPKIEFNFVESRSGSFGKLRLDSLGRQNLRRANATSSLGPLGQLAFIDFSQNELHLSGTGFPIEEDCVIVQTIDHSYVSPYFDEATCDEKVRIRSFSDSSLVAETPWATPAPVHELVASERPVDDVRLSIEFSLIDALNRDIMTMFSAFDAIENAIAQPELLQSPDYPDLETLRNVYFNRISDKLNFKRFFEFFRWFDTSIGTFIEQLVPKKTLFKGTNFVIEPHVLERSKLEYATNEAYVSEEVRPRIGDRLQVQLFSGMLNKH